MFNIIFIVLASLVVITATWSIVVKIQTSKLRQHIDKLERMAREHDRSAKLLVRRDLELTRVTEQLRELDKQKSQFITVAAHQLRTPLSGIKWTLNMLTSGQLGPLTEEQKSFLTKAYENNDRMIGLVNDMLGADRMQSTKTKFNFQYINIRELLDNVLFALAPGAEKRKISISLNAVEDVPNALIDPDAVRLVIQNLLDNAIKYTMDGGRVDIELGKTDSDIVLCIADQGIGIPADQQKNLFERFFRARNAVKQYTDGSGLGLFIARSVMDRHGGKIWFESKEGEGSKFYISIPINNKNLIKENG